jgi:NADH-quinone oxidoreductase subunit C
MTAATMTHDSAVASLQEAFAADVLGTVDFRGERTLVVTKDSLLRVLTHCRDVLGFDGLIDITTIDQMGADPRFEIVYELYSYGANISLRVKSATPEDAADFPSATALWPAANWHEREAYDMMGVRFTGHPDLRRILMWEGYPFFPLRKEFPLAGKASEMPDVAFTDAAPLQGGPFITSPGAADVVAREPRAKGA